MAYEVQENCLFGGWTNTWSYEDDNGVTIPTIFDTKEEAEMALDYFFDDCQTAVDDGHMPDIPDRYDFRIVEITPKEDNDFYHIQAEHESNLIDNELESWVRSL
jgi:hypothetical protein